MIIGGMIIGSITRANGRSPPFGLPSPQPSAPAPASNIGPKGPDPACSLGRSAAPCAALRPTGEGLLSTGAPRRAGAPPALLSQPSGQK